MSLRNYREKIGLIDVSRPSIKPKVFSALVWIPSWEGEVEGRGLLPTQKCGYLAL